MDAKQKVFMVGNGFGQWLKMTAQGSGAAEKNMKGLRGISRHLLKRNGGVLLYQNAF